MSGAADDRYVGDPPTPMHIPEWALIVARNLRGIPTRDLMQAEESLRWLLRWARDLQTSSRSPPALAPAPTRPRSRSLRRGRRSRSRRSWSPERASRSPSSLTLCREAGATLSETGVRAVHDPTERASAPVNSSGVAAASLREGFCSQDAAYRRPKAVRATRSPSPRGSARRVVAGPYRLPTLSAGRPRSPCLLDDAVPARGSSHQASPAFGPGQPSVGVQAGPPPLSSPNNLPVDRGQVLRTGGGYELVLRRASRRAPSDGPGIAKADGPSASSGPPPASPAAPLEPRSSFAASTEGGVDAHREALAQLPRTAGRAMRSRSSP